MPQRLTGQLENCWRRKALVGSIHPSASGRRRDSLDLMVPQGRGFRHSPVFGKIRHSGKMGTKGRHPAGKKSFCALSAFVLAFTLMAVPFAQATEVTRESYKEAVELDLQDQRAGQRTDPEERSRQREGRQAQLASTQFTKAASALHKAIPQSRPFPSRPPTRPSSPSG